MSIGGGLYSPNASGGDKGADSINVLNYYKNGAVFGLSTPITTKTADYTLLAADVGGYFKMNSASPHTFTLLSGATAGNGGQINFESMGAGITTITPAGSDTIASGGSTALTSKKLSQGDKGYLISDGGSPAVWTWIGQRHYDSGAQTITSNAALTLTHNLGVQPQVIKYWLRNITAQAGFTTGQEVEIPPGMAGWDNLNSGGSTTDFGTSTLATSTNIAIQTINKTAVFVVVPASGGSQGTALTNANWSLVVRAYVTN